MAPETTEPLDTRGKILEAAFAEFYLRGFQGASLDRILTAAGVTKGALYHHFRDKAALGYAVLEEVVREPILEAYLAPLATLEPDADPLAALQGTLRRRPDDFLETGIGLGCPLNNLTQEMSPLDEGFRSRVAASLETWTDGLADAIRTARDRGFVRREVDPRRIAGFVVASIEGAFGAAKAADSVDVLRANLEVLADFLDTLRPEAGGTVRPGAADAARRG